MNLKTIKDISDIKNKTFIVRVDWNVTNEQLLNLKNTRIPYSFKTIEYLKNQNAKIIILSHRGRREDFVDKKIKDNFSLKQVVQNINLEFLFKMKFLDYDFDKSGFEKIKDIILKGKSGDIFVLENLRFIEQEENNNLEFCKNLASLADIYINDAFACSHRKHASVYGITDFLPSFSGLLLENEVNELNKSLEPKSPSIAIFGGAKIDTKLKVIESLLKIYDTVLFGGGIANVLLKTCKELGLIKNNKDFCVEDLDDELNEYAKNLCKTYFNKMVFPIDAIVAKEIGEHTKAVQKDLEKLDKDDIILDIGEKTIELYKQKLQGVKNILWNGPMGMFEIPAFENGTLELSKIIGQKGKEGIYVVAGGGETLNAIQKSGYWKDYTFVSTAGGAMLEYLENKTLPCIEKLLK